MEKAFVTFYPILRYVNIIPVVLHVVDMLVVSRCFKIIECADKVKVQYGWAGNPLYKNPACHKSLSPVFIFQPEDAAFIEARFCHREGVVSLVISRTDPTWEKINVKILLMK